MDYFSLVIGFVVGAFTGAAGTYLGDKYTDIRRSKEQDSKADVVWKELIVRFPAIIDEMRQDVMNPECLNVREFFVKSRATTVNSSERCFQYHTDVHMDIGPAISHLVEIDYIEDITTGNCPKYRMRLGFIDRLKSS